MNELWPEYDMDESQSNVELKKESIVHIYYLCHGHKKPKLFMLLYVIIYICSKLVNYREKQRNY